MDHINSIYKNELLQRIINHLIINSSFLDSLGLFYGKTGIVIFFYQLFRYSNNSLYEKFSGELLDEIIEEIHDQLPINFENGYLGIGWAIEYLLQQKFISGSTNEILHEIDNKIMERDILRISDFSLNTGLEGIYNYVLYRLKNNSSLNVPFDKTYLNNLYNIACSAINQEINITFFELLNNYIRWYNNQDTVYNPLYFIKNIIIDKIPDNKNVWEWELGINDGCAGVGMKLIEFK